MKQRFLHLQRNEQGSVIVYVALLMGVFVGFMALSVDTGHWFAVRNELHNAGDASALRGARAYYPDDGFHRHTHEQINPDPATARAGARSYHRTQCRRQPGPYPTCPTFKPGSGTTRPAALEAFGIWPPAFGSFKGPGVTLSTRKEGEVNTGPVNNFFGRIFGTNTTNVGTVSAAALSGVGGFYKGTGTFPIAVNEQLVHDFGDRIILGPDKLDRGRLDRIKTR